MGYKHIKVPESGARITVNEDNSLNVPDNPIIPYIEGDGIGVDISPVMIDVVDAAVEKAYGGSRKISWMEIYTGEKAAELYEGDWFPEETLDAIKEYSVAIKGPLTTPVGGGFRSLNVALRQELDLYTCLRPVRWFEGVPSPVKNPGDCNMVIFRENSEDIYAGIEYEAGTPRPESRRFHHQRDGRHQDPLPAERRHRHQARVRGGHQAPRAQGDPVRHRSGPALGDAGAQGQHHEVHRGRLPRLGLRAGPGGVRWRTARRRPLGVAQEPEQRQGDHHQGRDRRRHAAADPDPPAGLLVVATLNLNGDYLSDALAAQVGGIGIAPGANLSDTVALFEATHGTAPKYAGQDKVNPGSLILSAEMMLRHLGWNEAADRIIDGMNGAIQNGTVTYDFERLMEGPRWSAAPASARRSSRRCRRRKQRCFRKRRHVFFWLWARRHGCRGGLRFLGRGGPFRPDVSFPRKQTQK
jgi:isocitrate dehydrogenase